MASFLDPEARLETLTDGIVRCAQLAFPPKVRQEKDGWSPTTRLINIALDKIKLIRRHVHGYKGYRRWTELTVHKGLREVLRWDRNLKRLSKGHEDEDPEDHPGSKRVQGFSLEGLTDQGISYTDPATVHAKITTHFSDWYTAPQGPWAVPIPSPDAHWSQLEAPWEDFKEGLASKNIPEIPLRKIYDALNSDKIERGSCLAALQCPTSDDFRGAIRASKKNSTPGMSGL